MFNINKQLAQNTGTKKPTSLKANVRKRRKKANAEY